MFPTGSLRPPRLITLPMLPAVTVRIPVSAVPARLSVPGRPPSGGMPLIDDLADVPRGDGAGGFEAKSSAVLMQTEFL